MEVEGIEPTRAMRHVIYSHTRLLNGLYFLKHREQDSNLRSGCPLSSLANYRLKPDSATSAYLHKGTHPSNDLE